MQRLECSVSPLRCPLCLDVLEAGRARTCPDCGEAQHRVCALAHGGCARCAPRAGGRASTHPPQVEASLLLSRQHAQERRAIRAAFGLGVAAVTAGSCGLGWTALLLPRTLGPQTGEAAWLAVALGAVAVVLGLVMAALAGRQALRAVEAARMIRLCRDPTIG